MSTDQLSMSMFATRADYDEAVRVQHEQLPGLQLAVKLLAQIGDDDSDRAIAAVHAACDLAQRVADLESIVNAPRGTDAQIMKEREIAAAAIDGALAFGYQGTEAPEAWHWLLAAHNAGKRIADLEAERLTLQHHAPAQAVPDADGARYRWLKTRPIEVPTNGPDLALWSDSCGDALRGDDADAAIDAAMAAAPEHKA